MEKQRWEESERRRAEERRSEKRKSEKKEDAGARKGRKVAKHCLFPMICGSRGSKSRLAKAAGAEPCGEMREEKLHAVVARNTFPSKMHKTHQRRNTFGSRDVKKVHAVVARSTFQSHYTTLTTTTATAPTTLHYTSRQWQRQRQLHLHLQRHYSTLHYSPLHYTTLHSTTPH